MKTKFLLLLGLFAFGPQLFAQDDKKPEEKKKAGPMMPVSVWTLPNCS